MVARGSARPAIRAATVAAILIVASFLAPHPAVGDDLAAASTRVIALADRPEEIPPALLSTAKKTPSIGLERRGIASLTAAELDAADAILVRIPGDDLSALESPLVAAAVERGKGLVVIAGQDALLRIADDPRLAALLSLRPHDAESDGRDSDATKPESASEDAEREVRAAAVDLIVQVEDQAHPITECVTAFLHRETLRGSLGGIEIAKGARVLASAAAIGEVEPERWAPVIWTGFHGLGRTAVFALDAHTDESASGDLIAALAVRATGFASRARILVPLPAEIPVAALELGRSDSGSWQGWETRSGYYRGRQIAPVMSFLGADWLLRPERATTEEPERVLDWLEIRPGSSVADFGAGNGYFTLRLAKRVGATGRVYAVDIQQEMLDLLAGRARASGHENIELVLSSEKDPRLPPDGVDLILAVDVYHELSHPAETLEALRRALKKDGRLVLVEYRGEDPSVPIRPLHRMTRAQAEAELRPFGFRLAANGEFLRHQHILVFEKSADAKDDAAEGESSDAREEPAPSDKATNPPLEGSTPDPARESEPSDSDDLGESGKPNDSGGDRPSR